MHAMDRGTVAGSWDKTVMDGVIGHAKEHTLVASEGGGIESVKTKKTCYQYDGIDFPGAHPRGYDSSPCVACCIPGVGGLFL